MKNIFLIATVFIALFSTINSDAQTVSNSTKTIHEKYQAKAPPTQAFDDKAFGKSKKTTLRWLGMAGFLINSRGTTFMVDPLLEGFDMPMMIDFPILAKNVPHLDAVFVTHADNDHFSVPTNVAMSKITDIYHSTVYVDSLMKNLNLKSVGHDIGETFKVKNISIKLTPADHAYQNTYPGMSKRWFKNEDACGFWFDTPDGTIWATGDTRLLPEHLTMTAPDAILFDFSDSEWHFTFEGAVKIANAYPNAKLLLCHWGSVDSPDFAPFNGDPKKLYDVVVNPERIKVLAPGEPFVLEPFKKKVVMPTTKKTVDQFLTFLSKKDLDSLTLLFAENVNWSVPGNKSSAAPWLGQRNSRKEVREFYELLWENVEPITAKIKNIFIENEETVIAGEFTVKMIPTGNLVNSLFYIQMTVKNGLIVKYSLLGDSFAISESMVSRNLKSNDMMIRISEIEINSKYVNEYNSILEEESRASVQLEEGVIAIYPLFQKENPTQVRILEIYANREAYEAHLKTPHFQKYKTSTLKMVKSLKLMDMDNIDSQTMAEIFRKMQN